MSTQNIQFQDKNKRSCIISDALISAVVENISRDSRTSSK